MKTAIMAILAVILGYAIAIAIILGVNGALIAIGLWACHKIGWLLTVSFSWYLVVIITVIEMLIKKVCSCNLHIDED